MNAMTRMPSLLNETFTGLTSVEKDSESLCLRSRRADGKFLRPVFIKFPGKEERDAFLDDLRRKRIQLHLEICHIA